MATIDFDSEKGGNGQPGGVQSVDRALQILEILSRDGHAGVSEIAEEIGIHKSSVSRPLGSLVNREMVHFSEKLLGGEDISLFSSKIIISSSKISNIYSFSSKLAIF